MRNLGTQPEKLIEKALAGKRLHPDQTIEEEAERSKRFMVVSVNSRDLHQYWIDGFSETAEGTLDIVMGIDEEWNLVGVIDLREILLGGESSVVIQTGVRMVIDGVTIAESWDDI